MSSGEKEPWLKQRFLVAFMGFISFIMVSCLRFNMSIGIVAMVNHSDSTSAYSNDSLSSCPMTLDTSTTSSSEKDGGEFDWNPAVQGYILSSSFFGYILLQTAGGKMAQVLGAKTVIVIGEIVSSLANLCSVFAARWHVYLLIFVQLIRGMAQGIILASMSVLMAKWFPRTERGFLSSFVLSGFSLGSMVGGVASGALCSSTFLGGWPSVFYVFGTLGILVALAFIVLIYESPQVNPRISRKELTYILENQESDMSVKRTNIPWKKMFTSIKVYALIIALFGQYWALSHFYTIHPTFLGTILHFPIEQNGILSSAPFILQAVSPCAASWLSDYLVRRNYVGVNKVRKGWNLISCVGYSVCLLGMYAAGCSKNMSNAFAVIAIGMSGLGYAGSVITGNDMSPNFAGPLMGICYAVSGIANFVLPLVVGYLTNGMQTLAQWNKVFFISIAVSMGCGLVFSFFGSADVQPWNFVNDDVQSQDLTSKAKFKQKESQDSENYM